MAWGYVSYHGVSESVVVEGTLKCTDYIDILGHNLLDSTENMFGDAVLPFLSQHDNTQCVCVCVHVCIICQYMRYPSSYSMPSIP